MKHHRKQPRTRKDTAEKVHQGAITQTLKRLDQDMPGTIIATLQMLDEPLTVTNHAEALLWGAALGRPFYLTMDDYISKN